MSLGPRRGLLSPLLLLWLCLPATAHAHGGVEDAAVLFGRDARGKADDAIDEIWRRTHKDLLIETVRKLPGDKLKEYRALKTDAERARFIQTLAEERARRADVDGVCVVLCCVPAADEPRQGVFRLLPRAFSDLLPPQIAGHAVIVWPATNDPYFPEDDRAKLNNLFGKIKARDHNQDQVLLEAVKFAGDELEANARAQGAPPVSSFRWIDVLWAAAVLAVAWAVLAAARARLAARQGASGPAPGLSQAFAPLLGIAGAFWLFEAYQARHQEAPSPPAEPAPPPELPAEGPMHPDDVAAIRGPAGPWVPEDREATTGHDLP